MQNLKVSQRYVAVDTHTQTVCHDNIATQTVTILPQI